MDNPKDETKAQPPNDNRRHYRAVILGRCGSEVLLLRDHQRLILPTFEVRSDRRVVEQLNEDLQHRFGILAHCLFPLPSAGKDHGENCPCYVMECRETQRHVPIKGEWVNADCLNRNSTLCPEDVKWVHTALAEATAHYDANNPFKQIGWMDDLLCWAQSQSSSHGLRLTGRFRQIDAGPDSALVRIETNGPALWFKAAGCANAREFPITAMLSRRLPQFLPVLLAFHSKWRGWLSEEFDGRPLTSASDPRHWTQTSTTLADLQIRAIGHVEALLGAGCRDLRCGVLLREVDPFFGLMDELMKKQRTESPSPLETTELAELNLQVKEAISALADLCIPDTLGHLDLNPGNVLNSASRCVFLDWADAYVGPPFLTFEYLRACSLRANQAATPGLGLERSYGQRWSDELPAQTIRRGYELSRLIAIFAYACGTGLWQDAARIHEPRLAGFLRSLTRQMHREAKKLTTLAAPTCTSD